MVLWTTKDGIELLLSMWKYEDFDIPALFSVKEQFNNLPAAVKQKTYIFCAGLIEEAQQELAAGTQLWAKARGMEGERMVREMLAPYLLGWGERLIAAQGIMDCRHL